MIEIGENLESLLTTVTVFSALVVAVWALNRPGRCDHKDEE